MQRVIVKAPAKLNLALAVLGTDERGYHILDMLMQAVSVYEHIEIEKSRFYSLSMPGSPPAVQRNKSNTATQAAEIFFTELGLLAGARITIIKSLPVRAGLAGGSADAAGVLVGLNELYGARLTLNELCELGAKIGADVPFAIMGGTARAKGTGEKLTKLKALEGCYFTIAMPKGKGNSTPEVYARFDEIFYEKGLTPPSVNVSACVEAAQSSNLQLLAANMQNALEAAAADDKTCLIKNILNEAGAMKSMMTGSGAAVFGIFDSEQKAAAAAQELKPHCSHVFVAQPDANGARCV